MKKIFCSIIVLFFTICSYSQTLTTVSPNSAQRGTSIGVTISGNNLHFAQATNTTVWFAQGSSTVMYPTSIQPVNNLVLSTYFQIDAQQPVGVYSLYMNNNMDGFLTLYNCFTVDYNVNQPQLVSVTPNSAYCGDALSVTISGQNTNFLQGTGTITWFQQGTSTIIFPNTHNATSATSMTANYTIPLYAVPGYYDTYTYNLTDGLIQLNSSFHVTQYVGISEVNEHNDIEIYPNPSSTFFYLNIKSNTDNNINIQIFNVLGENVYVQNHISQFPSLINIENLVNGIYFVDIIQNNKRIATKKVFINR
jgi:hypothetical protein